MFRFQKYKKFLTFEDGSFWAPGLSTGVSWQFVACQQNYYFLIIITLDHEQGLASLIYLTKLAKLVISKRIFLCFFL